MYVNKLKLQLNLFDKKFIKLDGEEKEQKLKLSNLDKEKLSYSK